jgi:hypothetical protein
MIKRAKNFTNFSGSKWNGPNCSKTFKDRSGTNQIVPKLFKIELEQTKMFQNFSRSYRSKMIQIITKLFKAEVAQSEQNRAHAWHPPQLVIWIRGKESMMDVPDQASPSMV